jgi:hypothetical protein
VIKKASLINKANPVRKTAKGGTDNHGVRAPMETEVVMGGKEWLVVKMAMVEGRTTKCRLQAVTPKAGVNDLRMGKPPLEMTHVD